MPELLASADDLRIFLDEDETELPDERAELLLEIATGEVQAAARQHLFLVEDDPIEIIGTTQSWLTLPERPAVEVASVHLDGQEITDYQRFGARLFRAPGWANCIHEPGQAAVVYTHGYQPGHPRLRLARKLTLRLAAHLFANPTTATGYSIDDYREQYSHASEDRGDLLPPRAQRQLRRHYGSRGGLVRLG